MLKYLFDVYLRLLPVFSINRVERGGGVSKISLCNREKGHIVNVTDRSRAGRRAKFSPETALRNV